MSSTSSSPLAVTLTLHQLVIRAADLAPEGEVFATDAEAQGALGARARAHLAEHWATDAAAILRDSGRAAPIPALEALSDLDCVELANSWDGVVFESDLSTVQLTLSADALVAALRSAGAAVCVVQPSDVPISDPSRAATWLTARRNELEGALATCGNQWLEDNFDTAVTLVWRDEDYGDLSGVKAAFRLRPREWRQASKDVLATAVEGAGFAYNGDRAAWYAWTTDAATD